MKHIVGNILAESSIIHLMPLVKESTLIKVLKGVSESMRIFT